MSATNNCDYNCLCSIELVVVDQAGALLMRNRDHLENLFKHLNLIPNDPHGCDFGCVGNRYLDNDAKYFRPTLVFRGFVAPEMMKLFKQSMLNAAGKVMTKAEFAECMIDLGVQVRRTVPPPAPNPTVPLTDYHITDIHENTSPNPGIRPRRPLRHFSQTQSYPHSPETPPQVY